MSFQCEGHIFQRHIHIQRKLMYSDLQQNNPTSKHKGPNLREKRVVLVNLFPFSISYIKHSKENWS